MLLGTCGYREMPTVQFRLNQDSHGKGEEMSRVSRVFQFGVAAALALGWQSAVLAATWGDYGYTESGGEITITGYTGAGGAVEIPGTIDGKTVTSIGKYAFAWHARLASVTIPSSVTSIGNDAFGWCTSLASVTIPSSVTSIGDRAFCDCTSLAGAYFEGNAPSAPSFVVDWTVFDNATVYRLAGATGWPTVPDPWCGRPTALWDGTFVETPTFNPDGGEYLAVSVTVMVSCATEGATIRYTTDGSWPTETNETVASGGTVSVPLPGGTLKARAWKDGKAPSAIKTASYTTATAVPGDYMVIDLSWGPAASSYTVSYLRDVPPGGWTEEHKTTKLVMRKISAGTFTMGSPDGELGRGSDETQHQVTLTKNFYIGVFEVTQKQWELVMGTWPSYFTNATYRDSRPVEQVSYYDIRENPDNSAISPNWPDSAQVYADSFIGKLRAKTGLRTLDMPTESQWEYACRAGTTTALNSGKNLTDTVDCTNMSDVGRYWYNGGSGYSQGCAPSAGTAAVGSYLPNQWGLYDMHGNVWEWCLDWHETYPGTVTDPEGEALGSDRVKRGGSWCYFAMHCRSAYRYYYYVTPSYRSSNVGFRLARTLQPGTQHTPFNDYDGDGCSDLAIYDDNSGAWYAYSLISSNAVVWGRQWGWPGAETVPGDYDGDGSADLAVYDQNTGHWYVWSEAKGHALLWERLWGWPGAETVPGDYDGDAKSDLAVYDQLSGFWYIITLGNKVLAWKRPWGWTGAITVPGDYDGDGIDDLCVYDQNTGYWYVQTLSAKVLAWAQPWGWPGATTVPGDYDRDAFSDMAVYDQPRGAWYVWSQARQLALIWNRPWGWPGAVPVPGDYDGDGNADLAVFDTITGYWYIWSVAKNTTLVWQNWGWPGANPPGGRK